MFKFTHVCVQQVVSHSLSRQLDSQSGMGDRLCLVEAAHKLPRHFTHMSYLTSLQLRIEHDNLPADLTSAVDFSLCWFDMTSQQSVATL